MGSEKDQIDEIYELIRNMDTELLIMVAGACLSCVKERIAFNKTKIHDNFKKAKT